MTYPIRCSSNLWEIPELTQINRLPMHSGTLPYPTAELAAEGDPGASPWMESLNGDWKFSLFHRVAETNTEMFSEAYDDASWNTLPVPSNWTMQGLWDKPAYTNVKMYFENTPPIVPLENPTGVYRNCFSLPADWDGRRTIVHFGAVENYLELYINGQFIGLSKDNRLPAEFDISAALKTGPNTIALRVLKWCDANYIEDQDQWWQAGIIRDVFLYSTDQAYIQDIFARCDLDLASGDGLLDLDVKLGMSMAFLPQGPQEDFRVSAELFDAEGHSIFSSENTVDHHFRISGYATTFTTRIADCAAWSAEFPKLYSLQVTLKDAGGKNIEARQIKVGFKHVEVANRELLINGKPVLIRGINRHDHDETTGRVISRESMITDIKLMKQFNFNAVRSAHYPNDPMWYDLCDEFGMYVIDEANLESHANYNNLCRDPRWRLQHIERGTRMIQRDRNHACIFAWSLGNESGNGENHDSMYEAMKALDDSRIFHHEGEIHAGWHQFPFVSNNPRPGNDLVNPMYPSVAEIKSWAETTQDHRPLISCEYSHAMGNSCGNLKEYWDLFHNAHGLQGGFIWEWCDHGIKRTDEQGRDYWAYGGDFGEESHDFNFCADGMVSPDRVPHPAMYEFKKVAQPIQISASQLTAGDFELHNRFDFRPLEGLSGTWSISVDGIEIEKGKLPSMSCAPQATELIQLNLKTPLLQAGQEAQLLIEIVETEDTLWCEAGHVIAWEQFELDKKDTAPTYSGTDTVEMAEQEGLTSLSAGSTTLVVDQKNAQIISIKQGDEAILEGAPQLCMWRATTDNDGIRGWSGQEKKPMGQWIAEGFPDFHCMEKSLELFPSDGKCEIQINSLHAGKGSEKKVSHQQKITLLADGSIQFDHVVDADRDLPSLPRIGVTLKTTSGFENLKWFGRGPWENHIDRKEGCPVGMYSGSVDEQYVPYILPQENGNKCDVRWFELDNGSNTLKFTANDLFEFSVRHYTDADLFNSFHLNELADKKRPETIIHIDHIQRGVGTGSCGPQTLDEYCILPGRYEFGYTLELR